MKEISVAVNVRHLIPHKMEGIGWFSYQMMKRITQKQSNVHFYFLFDRNFSEEFLFSDNITPIIISPPARHPLLIYYWNEWLVPHLLNKIKPDIYLSLDGFVSKKARYRQYAVVHDVNFMVFPEYLTWGVKKLYHYFFIKNIHHAQRIATVSNFSKSEIIKYLNYPEKNIDVVYSAVNLNYSNDININEDELKNKYTNGHDYFLYISSIHPRKNVDGLILAFNEYKKITQSQDKLIIVGRFFWGKNKITEALNNSAYKQDIVFTGRLSDEESAALLKHAKAFVYVSHYEGFGVPIIEAMQAGVPVITSNTTSLNEISDNAALKVNPKNVSEIAQAMCLINDQLSVRKTLVNKGYVQSQKYNWDNCAELLWQGLIKLL